MPLAPWTLHPSLFRPPDNKDRARRVAHHLLGHAAHDQVRDAAAAVRRVLDHAGEEIWLDILGAMARTPEPGAAALGIILAKALPAGIPSARMG